MAKQSEGEKNRQNMNSEFNVSLSFYDFPSIQLSWICVTWLKPFVTNLPSLLPKLCEVTIAKLPGDYFTCNNNDTPLY